MLLHLAAAQDMQCLYSAAAEAIGLTAAHASLAPNLVAAAELAASPDSTSGTQAITAVGSQNPAHPSCVEDSYTRDQPKPLVPGLLQHFPQPASGSAEAPREPLSPTTAKQACYTSWPGAAAGKSPHAPVQISETPLARQFAPVSQAGQHSSESQQQQQQQQRSGSGSGSGTFGQKLGHTAAGCHADMSYGTAVANEGASVPVKELAEHDCKRRIILSKNQAHALARSGVASTPKLAAWTQNSDDTDDFMI